MFGSGVFLQKNSIMNRKTFLQMSGLLVSSTVMGKIPSAEMHFIEGGNSSASNGSSFPLMDLHVHRSRNLTIDDIVAKSKELNMKIGVMENISPWGIKDDEKLKEYIDTLRPYPVFIGLQPMSLGWSKNLSPDLIAQADYVAMDPQVVPNGNSYGETINVWEYSTYIDDAEAFMEQNMKHYMNILTGNEPLDIFACPLFLPSSLERHYNTLWNKKRLQQIIDAAKARNVAIEINDVVQVPHEEFILMAKHAGLKFTFGSDARNQFVGRLIYCKRMAQRCQLTEKDFFIPRSRT